MAAEPGPQNERFRVAPFAAHSVRGIIRDRGTRRKVMLFLLGVALLMVLTGSTFLAWVIEPREHLLRFVLFWFACAWITITALLLAVFDLVSLRAEGRA